MKGNKRKTADSSEKGRNFFSRMIEILEHSLGRYEMENEILEAGWDISKNGQEKHIYLTPLPNEGIAVQVL